jgi:putative FmdB family regulatory protein
MPTYDYVCDECDYAFEQFQQMTDPVKRKCPGCGKRTLRRLIGPGAGVIFKGDGFYQTDYRSESYKKAAESEKKAASEKKATADKKKDSKTAKPAAKKSEAPKNT